MAVLLYERQSATGRGTSMTTVDVTELDTKVRQMYRHVAEEPRGAYHFDLGRDLAERLGYPADRLDRIPGGAVESVAGVATSSTWPTSAPASG